MRNWPDRYSLTRPRLLSFLTVSIEIEEERIITRLAEDLVKLARLSILLIPAEMQSSGSLWPTTTQ